VAANCILLVDDDPDVRNALRFAFETEGYEVQVHASGEEILSRAPLDRPACLIIDERLPGLSGLDTVLKWRKCGAVMPAILITTHPSRAIVQRAAAAGVQICEKPLIGDALARMVRAQFSPAS